MKKIIIFTSAMFLFVSLRAQENSKVAAEKIISVAVKGCAIEGTLLSSGAAKQKIALIIAGSGPTDRNGNNPMGVAAASYKMIAGELIKQGIATFRYDKRGVGKSVMKGFKETDLTFDDYVNDAIALLDYLKDSLHYKNIYVIGHSEGSLLGMIACARRPVQGYISLSGAGRPIDEIVVEQLTNQQQPPAIITEVKHIFARLKAGQTTDSVPQYLYSLFRPSVQPYMISWLKYTPPTEIAKVQCPVLILQGSCDIQVMVKDAENLHHAQPNSRIDIIPQMTHVLKNAGDNCKDENQKTYTDSSLPLNTQLIKDIAGFIQDKT